jgi:hypothetical protein
MTFLTFYPRVVWYHGAMGHHVIVIPGIGDHRSFGQDLVVKVWKLYGLETHFMALGWSEKHGYDAKQTRLLTLVDTLHAAGHTVSLVGISAGGSAVINAFAASDKIHRVVCICGKLQRPDSIGKPYYNRNPDFEESMHRLASSYDKLGQDKRVRIMSTHPWHDNTVPIADTRVAGTLEKTLPGWGHISGIFFALTYGGLIIARFIKR